MLCRIIIFCSIYILAINQAQSQNGNVNYSPCNGGFTIPRNVTNKSNIVVSQYFKMVSWNSAPYQSFTYNLANSDGMMHFRLMPPPNYNPTKKYPLIVMLHGKGEAGAQPSFPNPCTPAYIGGDKRYQNNDHQLTWGGKLHMDANKNENGNDFEAFVLFPHSADGNWSPSPDKNAQGQDVYGSYNSFSYNIQRGLAIIDSTIAKYSIDKNRVYIHGLSGGGGGTWEMAYRRPELFAAVLPMCAPSLYKDINGRSVVQMLTHTPLWITQGGADANPRPIVSQNMIDSLKKVGNDPRYSEWAGIGHVAWPLTYNLPSFLPWIYAQNLLKIKIFGINDTMNTATTASLCPGQTVRLGINAHFQAYRWSKNGVEISGQTSNDLYVSEVGTYRVRFRRGATEWTDWSAPVEVISNTNITPKPIIFTNESTALVETIVTNPRSPGKTNITLNTVDGMQNYLWSNGSTTKSIFVAQQNSATYTVVTTKAGYCKSVPSDPLIITNKRDFALEAPSILTSSNITATTIDLTWQDNSSAELGFDIFREEYNTGPYLFVGKVPSNTTAFTVKNLAPNTTHKYVVRAFSNKGFSLPSNFASGRTLPFSDNILPSVPSGFVVTAKTANSITVSWLPSTDNIGIAGYEVYLDNVLMLTTANNVYRATGLNASTNYTFKIRAKDLAGNFSPYTNDLTTSINFVNGVNYTYHLGTWDKVPNFAIEPVVKFGVVNNFDLSPRTQNDYFGFNFNTYIDIPVAGNYRFYTDSDDGSLLYVNGVKVVDNDGLHGTAGTLEAGKSGVVNLSVGKHLITVGFIEYGGGESLQVGYKAAGSTTSVSPLLPSQLFIIGEPVVDNTAPTAVTNLAVIPKRNTAKLTWTASTDNIGVVGYQIKNGSTILANNLMQLEYNATNLLANTSYSLTVIARDRAGNSSGVSTITFTTLQNTAPQIATIPPFDIQEGKVKTINVQTTDADGDAVATSIVSLPSFVTFISIGNGSSILQVAPPVYSENIYNNNRIKASDGYNGEFERSFNFTVLPQPDAIWDGGANTNLWTDSLNWVGNKRPNRFQKVVLNNSGLNTSYTVDANNANLVLKSIQVGQATGGSPITLVINGAPNSTKNIADGVFTDLTVLGAGKVTLNCNATVGNTALNSSILDIGNNTITFSGEVSGNPNAIVSGPNGTVEYASSATQYMIGGTYKNLKIAGTGDKIPAGNLLVEKVLELSSGNINLLANSNTLTVDVSNGCISPLGVGSISGRIKVQRTIVNKDWHYISSPLDDARYADINSSYNLSNNVLYTYQESQALVDNSWILRNTQDLTTKLSVEKDEGGPSNMIGYVIDSPQESFLLGISGYYRHGATVSYTTDNMSYTNTGDEAEDGWQLIGNPFPTYINWLSAGVVKNNVENNISFYNSALGLNADYTGAVPDSVNGASRFIPPMQGFWVRTKANGGSVTVNNSARVVNPIIGASAPSFYRKTNNATVKRLKLQITNENCVDEIIVRFLDEAIDKFESDYDVVKQLNDAQCPSAYTLINNIKTSINSLPINFNGYVPMAVKGLKGKYTISIKEMDGFDNMASIYLEDKSNSTIHDLKAEPLYSYTAYEGDNSERFALIFKDNTTSIDELKSMQSSVALFSENKKIYIKEMVNLTNKIVDFKIFNALGQQVIAPRSLDLSSGLAQYEVEKAGFYMVEIIADGKLITHKIIAQ